jgi:DNA/RNA endonuclease YhcR with UshA esterase domain
MPSATVTPPSLTPIGEVENLLGQEVTVEGTVIGTASFSGGFKLTLDDGSGQVELVMWHRVYDDCWDAPELNLGTQVRATGEVDTFEGVLQITPRWGSAVQVVMPAAVQAESRAISSLSAADEGRRVMIEGQVIRTEGLDSAVKVFVRDESGEALVFIWRNVLDRIPDNVGLGTEGSRVRVVGAVAMYRGTLEIVPTLPYDVVVLEIP